MHETDEAERNNWNRKVRVFHFKQTNYRSHSRVIRPESSLIPRTRRAVETAVTRVRNAAKGTQENTMKGYFFFIICVSDVFKHHL